MSQHDMVIDNGPGLAVRTDINAAIQALASTSLGAVEPTVKYAGQLWLDTSVAPNGVLRQRDQSNAAWVALQTGEVIPVKASAADVVAGIDDAKFITALALKSATTRTQTILTTSGTYTKPAGLKYLELWVVGGGGGGGKCLATGAGASAAGGGGGGGGVVYHFYAAAALSATEAYVVGAGGAGGAAGVPTAGGASTFKGLTASGGNGGSDGGTTGGFSATPAGTGGAAAGGFLNTAGSQGNMGLTNIGAVGVGRTGSGGCSHFTTPALELYTPNPGVITHGKFPGGGGCGTAQGASQPQVSGGNGGAGCIILKEYF